MVRGSKPAFDKFKLVERTFSNIILLALDKFKELFLHREMCSIHLCP